MRYKYLIILSILACAVVLCGHSAGFAASILNSADDYAVLAGSGTTNTGSTTITGDVGSYPNGSIGKTGITLTGTGAYHEADADAQQAQIDLTTAYTGLAAMTYTTDLTGLDLGGRTLTSGVYRYSSGALLNGTLTLDAQGNNDAYWVFQIGSTLTTGSGSAVNVINPGSNNGLFWQVGSSATLGTTTAFQGNILALDSIGLNTGATILNGSALARTAAVTMQGNTINKGFNGGLYYDSPGHISPTVTPEPVSMLLFGIGGATLAFIKRRRKSII